MLILWLFPALVACAFVADLVAALRGLAPRDMGGH